MNPPNLSGFDSRVQDQLAQLSLNQETRSNSDTQSHSSYHSASRQPTRSRNSYNTYIHPQNMRNHRQSSGQNPTAPWSTISHGPDAFPPLGSTRPAPPPTSSNMEMNSARNHYQQQQSHAYNANGASTAAQEFFSRARGGGRGRGRAQAYRQDNNDLARAPPRQNNQWSNQNQPYTSHDQHRGFRHRTMEQADYLDHLTQKTMTNMLPRQEIEQKHAFRQKLEALAKHVAETDPSLESDPMSHILRLQSYGSLSNSFGTSGCDMDLLLTIEKKVGDYVDITEKYKRDLEKALLDLGIGARLLTNTRIPIIRVCEKPTSALLENLKENRRLREVTELAAQTAVDTDNTAAPLPLLPKSQNEQQAAAFADLDPAAADIPLPKTPVIDHAKLEFVGDCGIQCDINFTNHVALINTKMLWTYGQCDVRVRHMGIFVKNWAKARAINTPYHGTLSSYGYILMVLHYLMNVASPPVIPNLQEMAHRESWEVQPADLFEGHDIRYVSDLNRIREYMATAPKNQSSLGGLLQGFFRYYAAHDGFNWTQDVISIRSFGGILSKQAKGWTGAKWTGTKQNVRLRYLLAIEDPFELEHNVARTVGHNGIKAIRDEFRRSWTMIQGVQRVQDLNGTSWVWMSHNRSVSGDGLDFIKPSEDRGDLLKKDADFRKEQLRLLKQKTEADEELARKQALIATSEDELGELYGMSSGQGDLSLIDTWAEDQAVLIHDMQLQDKKVTRMRGPDPIHRKPTTDEDDTDDEESIDSEQHVPSDERSYQTYADEWVANTDVPLGSEVGSEDWATAYETTSPDNERHDEGFDGLEKVTDEQDPRDAWKSDPPSNNLHDHREDASGWDDARQQVTPNNWNGEVDEEGNADRNNPEMMSPRTKRQMRSTQPPPEPTDDIPQIPQDASTQRSETQWQYDREDQNSDRVGDFIEWSADTVGGRWLLNRDTQIRDGKRIELTAGDRGKLNAKFPYNPDMTQQQLSEKNDQLEKYYKTSLYSRQSSDMQSRSLEAEKATIKAPSTAQEDSWDEPDTNFMKPDINKIIDAGLIGDGIYWSNMTGVGVWLGWRDRKILAGLWNPRDSLASLLTELFPRDATTTVADQNRMNWELDNFFAGLDYPRPNELTREEMDEAAGAIREAAQRTQKYRTWRSGAPEDQPRRTRIRSSPFKAPLREVPGVSSTRASMAVVEDEAVDPEPQIPEQFQPVPATEPSVPSESVKKNDQSKILLDMFRRESQISPKTTRHALDPDDQSVINQRSMTAVMQLSKQLTKAAPKNQDFVRAQRLAYFQKQKQVDTVDENVSAESSDRSRNAGLPDDRRDSGTEGSWNRPHPSTRPYGSQPRQLDRDNLANLQKILKGSEMTTHSGDDDIDN